MADRRTTGAFVLTALAALCLVWWLLSQTDRTPSTTMDGVPQQDGLTPPALESMGLETEEGGEEAPLHPPGPSGAEAGAGLLMSPAYANDDPALPPARRPLSVTVVDRDGAPVPRAMVRAKWGEWFTQGWLTDEDGRVEMKVPPNTRGLEVVGQAGKSTGAWCFVHVHALAPDALETRVVMRQWRYVRGSVTIDGRPAKRGTVYAYRHGRPLYDDGVPRVVFYRQPQQVGMGSTAGDGRFSFRLPDDAPVTLIYEYWSDRGQPIAIRYDVTPGDTDIRMQARGRKRLGSVRVLVLDPSGAPVEGESVSFYPIQRSRVLAVDTDASGRAQVAAIDDWLYRINIGTSREGKPRWANHMSFVRADGSEHVIQLQPPSAPIEGAVIDADGNPVQGAWVCVMDGPNYAACMRTNAQGRFRGPSNRPAGTSLNIYARFPMEKPTARGFVENVEAGDAIRIELEELGPLQAKDVK